LLVIRLAREVKPSAWCQRSKLLFALARASVLRSGRADVKFAETEHVRGVVAATDLQLLASLLLQLPRHAELDELINMHVILVALVANLIQLVALLAIGDAAQVDVPGRLLHAQIVGLHCRLRNILIL